MTTTTWRSDTNDGTPPDRRVERRVVRDCIVAGVPADRIVSVVNRAPRRGPGRSETARTISELFLASHPGEALLSPVFLPERRHLDDVIRDVAPLPAVLVDPVTAAVRARLDAIEARAIDPVVSEEPVPVEVGSLGEWDQEVAG